MPRVGWKPSPEGIAKFRATMYAKHGSPRDRFMRHIEYDTNGGCWLWSGTITPGTGYGQIQIRGKAISAHRLSFKLFSGGAKPGQVVCHKCDVRACVNPAHLYAGSYADNVADMWTRGRANTPFGEDHAGAKITEADIPRILARLLIGHGCAEIAADYGVTDCAINAIRRGKSWNHVTGLPKTAPRKFVGQGRGGANNAASEAA